MKAQLKCSNCGAEISNLNISWGRKQWLWSIVIFIIIIGYMLFFNFFIERKFEQSKHNFRDDLIIKDTEKRYSNGTIEILGIIENHGKVNWEHIYVKAELFDKDNKIVDLLTGSVNSNMLPGAIDHFKISAKEFPQPRWEAIKDMKIKVTKASHYRF